MQDAHRLVVVRHRRPAATLQAVAGVGQTAKSRAPSSCRSPLREHKGTKGKQRMLFGMLNLLARVVWPVSAASGHPWRNWRIFRRYAGGPD